MGSERPLEGPARRMGPWGYVVWVLPVLAVIVLVALMIEPMIRPVPVRPAVCLSNVKNIALAFQMYATDNDDWFPPAAGWCDSIREYVKNDMVYHCPSDSNPDCAFAFNAALDRASLADIPNPAEIVVVFESDRGWNAAGGPELLPAEPRHEGGDHYGFADGGAGWVKRRGLGRDDVGDLVWTKEPGSDEVRWEVEGDEVPALSLDGEDAVR